MASDLKEALAEAAGLAVLDLLAACLTLRPGRRKRGAQRKDRAPELARVERFIARKIADPDFGLETVGARFWLSRTALYRPTSRLAAWRPWRTAVAPLRPTS